MPAIAVIMVVGPSRVRSVSSASAVRRPVKCRVPAGSWRAPRPRGRSYRRDRPVAPLLHAVARRGQRAMLGRRGLEDREQRVEPVDRGHGPRGEVFGDRGLRPAGPIGELPIGQLTVPALPGVTAPQRPQQPGQLLRRIHRRRLPGELVGPVDHTRKRTESRLKIRVTGEHCRDSCNPHRSCGSWATDRSRSRDSRMIVERSRSSGALTQRSKATRSTAMPASAARLASGSATPRARRPSARRRPRATPS